MAESDRGGVGRLSRDPRLAVIGAVPPIEADFRAEGVKAVRPCIGFPTWERFELWLMTDSDEQRDALKHDDAAVGRVRDAAATAGLSEADCESLEVMVQSEETVQREYLGSWPRAMRSV